MYDSVGVVNAVFVPFFGKTAQGSPLVRIRVSRSPLFAFILTLDTRILTFTIGLVRISSSSRCARISPALSAGAIPASERGRAAPPGIESWAHEGNDMG